MKRFIAALLFVCTAAFGAPQAPQAPSVPTATKKIVLTEGNTVFLNDYFYGESVANLVKEAKNKDAALPSGEPLYLVMNSGGGSIEAGIELIENLKAFNRPVDTVTLWSASMGFQTVQGLGKRYILKTGTLMSHKARGGFYGEFPGQFDSRYAYYLQRVANMDRVTVARTAGKHTMQSYTALIENEYWCDGNACVEQGFADEVVDVACDMTLGGTKERLVDWWLLDGRYYVEYFETSDNCPTNTSPISWKIVVNGKTLKDFIVSQPSGSPSGINEVTKDIMDRVNQRQMSNKARTVKKEW